METQMYWSYVFVCIDVSTTSNKKNKKKQIKGSIAKMISMYVDTYIDIATVYNNIIRRHKK